MVNNWLCKIICMYYIAIVIWYIYFFTFLKKEITVESKIYYTIFLGLQYT